MTATPQIEALWRYPVKSMLGERLDELVLETRGVVGDRGWAVRTPEGKLGSGKNTRRFAAIFGLFDLRAEGVGDGARIRFPDGRTLRADDSAIHDALTETFDRPLVLAREDDVPHHDRGPIHVLTTASLRWLRRELPGAAIDERRFRPNLLVDLTGDEPIEQTWIGRSIRVGDEVELRVTEPTERCGMVTFAQDDLPKDPRVYRVVEDRAELLFGVYAEVVRPGAVRLGDSVRVLSGQSE